LACGVFNLCLLSSCPSSSLLEIDTSPRFIREATRSLPSIPLSNYTTDSYHISLNSRTRLGSPRLHRRCHLPDTTTQPTTTYHVKMTSTYPNPTQTSNLPRNDSFSTDDIKRAFQASERKPRNHLSLKIAQTDEPSVPPPSPLQSRPSSCIWQGYNGNLR